MITLLKQKNAPQYEVRFSFIKFIYPIVSWYGSSCFEPLKKLFWVSAASALSAIRGLSPLVLLVIQALQSTFPLIPSTVPSERYCQMENGADRCGSDDHSAFHFA